MMPAVSASGECGPTLFVFKDRIHYRNVLRNGVVYTETLTDYLSNNSVVASRDQLGGVDSVNFLSWEHQFVSHVKHFTSNGPKVLLIYDGYRAQMSLEVLQLFKQNGIIVYALPAHTSGKTQPLDLICFAIFKATI